jgi:Na+/proline symporter
MLGTIDYLFIAVYFVIILLVGFWTGHKQEKEDYLIANRKLNAFQATTTIFSSRIGAAVLLTYTALVYLYGLGALWYFIGSVFGLFIFYFFGIKLKKIADKEKFYTLPDYFFFMKGRFAGYLATIIVIIIMFGWVVLNFIAGAKLIDEYTPISYDYSVIIIGLIILVYLVAGGFSAVVKTDIIQTIGIFLLFILMVYLLITSSAKPKLVFMDLFRIPIVQLVSFFLAGFFIPLASPELWQRVYAVKNKQHFKRSMIMSSVFYVIIGFILLMIGMVVRISIPELESADSALIKGFSSLLPIGLAGLSVVIIYSAVSSSADTYLFTSAASVAQDFMEKSKLLKKDKLFVTMRVTMAIMTTLGIVLALIMRDFVDATFFFVSMTMSLGFLVMVMWIYPKINRHSVNFSIFFCLVGVIIPAIFIGISETLVSYAWGLCILGLLFGMVMHKIKPLP